MNNALSIKNWNQDGNNYVLKGNVKNKWVGYQKTVLDNLQERFGDDFNIVIWTDPDNMDDYYCIPFIAVKHLFTEEHMTAGNFPNRWTSIVLNNRFLMHSNSQLSIDISSFYATQLFSIEKVEFDEDYYIEDAKANVNIRIGQSKFRKGVLENFGYECALSGVTEESLLRASHIVPWADNKKFRADVSNGICLYVEYDALFDKGIISFNDTLEV